MIGITLTDEQIRNAPAPVRQWIEQQVIASLGVTPQPGATSLRTQAAHLASCDLKDAEAVLREIQDHLSAVNVFFEFRRSTICYGQPPVMLFRLLDLQHHTGLQDVGQVMACLDMISQAFERTRQDALVRFCAFDNDGHCLIPPETQQCIATLWQRIVQRQQLPDGKDECSLSAA
jgi:hypothetical protein